MISSKAREKAREMRYKQPALRGLNYDYIYDTFMEIEEECDNVRYFMESGDDTLLNALDGDEEEEYEFRMMFADLSAKCEELRGLIDYDFPERFDDFFVGIMLKNKNPYLSPIKNEYNSERDESNFARGDYVNVKNLFYGRERADELHSRMVQWQALNDEPVDWDDPIRYKYYICFNYNDKELRIGSDVYSREEGVVYFTTLEKVKEAIEVFGDELMWYYTKYRSRLDEPRKGEDE